MPSYKCTKCDETMSSKNPVCRSIFQSDQIASIMTNIVDVVTVRKNEGDEFRGAVGKRVVTFTFPFGDTGSIANPKVDMTDDELEIQCMNNIRSLTDDQLTHWLCDHVWELVSGEVTVPI